MQSAVVIMSILGCSPQATSCEHIQTLDRRWATVALCDLASAIELPKHMDQGFPVVVAVCETPELFDEAEDGHHGEMVTKDKQLVMPGVPAGPPPKPDEQSIRIMRKTQPDINSQPKRAIDVPLNMARSAWHWIKRQFN